MQTLTDKTNDATAPPGNKPSNFQNMQFNNFLFLF